MYGRIPVVEWTVVAVFVILIILLITLGIMTIYEKKHSKDPEQSDMDIQDSDIQGDE